MRALVVFVVMAAAVTARADNDPWAVGVTEQQKTVAEAELDLGNNRFVEADYAGALVHYRTAIASWDHPAIRFNVVRCLIQLDKPIEAADELERALKYGEKPLEEAVYREALSYKKLLAERIGVLDVHCDQAATSLALDGKPLAKCPYAAKLRVLAGPHQIVGEHAGFLTKKVDVVVVGGATATEQIALVPISAAARVEHRFAIWLPWVVFGGGLAVAGAGGLLEANAAGQFDDYDQTIASQCTGTRCPASTAAAEKRRARRMNTVAVGVMSVGAAVVVGGAVMLVMNRGRTVTADEAPPKVGVVPIAGGAMASFGGSF